MCVPLENHTYFDDENSVDPNPLSIICYIYDLWDSIYKNGRLKLLGYIWKMAAKEVSKAVSPSGQCYWPYSQIELDLKLKNLQKMQIPTKYV